MLLSAAIAAITPARLSDATPLVQQLMDQAFCADLQRWTMKRCVPPADAEDVVGSAVVSAVQREAKGPPWDPDRDGSARIFMLNIIRGELANRRRRNRRRPGVAPEEPKPERVVSEDISPEEEVAERLDANERRRVANEIHADLVASGKDPKVAKVLEAVAAGKLGPSGIAAHTGLTVDEVTLAMERLGRLAKARVNALREKLKKP